MVGEETIIETAYALFKRRSIRSTSLQQVARASGTSLWDLSLIFKSKKDLVLAVVRHTVNKKTVHLLISSPLSPSAVTELNTFFKFVYETIGTLGADILDKLKRYQPLGLDQLQDIVDDKLIPWLQRNMQRGFREGFYREELDAELYASTYFCVLRAVLESESDWDQTRKSITHINDIFLHGVLNAKGMRI